MKEITNALTANNALNYLFLGENNIGSEGAKDIALALQTKATLYIPDVLQEGATGISLPPNSTLTYLDLSGNQIGDEGATELGRLLQSTKSLTYLNLSFNGIRDDGARAIAYALQPQSDIPTCNTSLTEIDIGMYLQEESGETETQPSNCYFSGLNKITDIGILAFSGVILTNKKVKRLFLGPSEGTSFYSICIDNLCINYRLILR